MRISKIDSRLIVITVVSVVLLLLLRAHASNLLYSVLVLVLGILLYLSLISGNIKLKFYVILLSAVSIFLALGINFDEGLFTHSSLEQNNLTMRQNYLSNGLGKLYGNRFSIFYFTQIKPVIIKYTQNLYFHLDLNTFFVVNNLISIPLLFLFLVGTIKLIKKINITLALYFLAIFVSSGFMNANEIDGYLLYIPFISIAITFGMFEIYSKLIHEKN